MAGGRGGVAEILDIGFGLPAPGNVHEVAREINPSVRTVYVDDDPVVYTHGQAALADARTTEVVAGDIRRPTEVVDHPLVRQFMDFRQPVGLLLLAVLHHISDDEDPSGVVAALHDAMQAGAISSSPVSGCQERSWPSSAPRPSRWRGCSTTVSGPGAGGRGDRPQWLGDSDMLPPGLVPLSSWRPNEPGEVAQDMTCHSFVGSMARKN